ncbi:hypothetical protein ASPZODRAFT_144543 [Penicilliopsis zonata CBS 506.65]|uniref:Uncharacterized protein n=1 Tax=Penicilliopsis zonata CBS 506.65 TaxID=1073090 RepID=A0A1L9SBW2_9EURO|nr:hypothetical protein ASPZODRAFT_144543 [Penicilliopsis zonata CBS 506.65]OJJ44577.1 hypothetical protein ASPZODRAFT_144543 [Penicilliopsis zonata CBS 506.65]
MSHQSGGYFYYRYAYDCPWTDADGQTGIDYTFSSSVYSSAQKNTHEAQSKWFTNTAMPAVQEHIERNFYLKADRNKKGRVYERFNWQYVRKEVFKWCAKLPVHTDGPCKGSPSGQPV